MKYGHKEGIQFEALSGTSSTGAGVSFELDFPLIDWGIQVRTDSTTADVRLRLGFNDYTWKVVSREDDCSPDVVISMLSDAVVVGVVWHESVLGSDECERVERVMGRLLLSDPDFFVKLTGLIGSLGRYYHGGRF